MLGNSQVLRELLTIVDIKGFRNEYILCNKEIGRC